MQNQPDNHIDFFAPKILWTIIGVLLLVVIVGSIYWWQEIEKEAEISKQQTESPSTSSGQSDVPSDWKTYTNSQYGFEIKYPNQWTLKENDGAIVSFLQNQELIGYVEYVDNFQNRFDALSPDTNKKITDMYQLDILASRLGTTVVGDLTGDPPWIYNIVYIKNLNKDTGISIWMIVNHDPPEYIVLDSAISTFKQILSTFKFTK